MDDKQFLDILKAIMYQLYFRKLMYVTFKGNPKYRNEWLLSNVPQETMLVYDESAEYHFAKVTIKDDAFLDEFYKRFPELLTHGALIHVVNFCSVLSKSEQLSDCTLSIAADGHLFMHYSQPSEDEPSLMLAETKDVGVVLPEIEVDMYYTVWQSGLVKSEDPFHMVCQVNDICDEHGAVLSHKVIVIQDIAHPSDQFKAQHALIIIQPGYTVPTLPSFLKATKDQTTSFELIAGYDRNSIIVNCKYDTALLSCLGTHPAQRWFVKDRR